MDFSSWTLLAEGEAAGAPGGLGALLQPLLMIGPIILLYVFLIHRPQKREQALRQEMLANLKKNDHVLTTSGIYGVVTNIRADGDEVTIRVDDNAKLRMARSAIARVIDESSGDKETNP